jgi:hypothetical protein
LGYERDTFWGTRGDKFWGTREDNKFWGMRGDTFWGTRGIHFGVREEITSFGVGEETIDLFM